MTLTPIQVLQEASKLDLELGLEPPDTLTFQPVECCPRDFLPVLKVYKPALLGLLRLPFVMVYSEVLKETIFFCEDGDTRAALVEAGAEGWSIYTRRELQTLCAQNCIAPLTTSELCKVHQIKRTFEGSITT